MPNKKKVRGVVDRVEGDVAVVVFKDPDTGDNREVYVDKKKLKKVELKEGDRVTVQFSVMEAEPMILASPAPKKKPAAKRPKKA